MREVFLDESASSTLVSIDTLTLVLNVNIHDQAINFASIKGLITQFNHGKIVFDQFLNCGGCLSLGIADQNNAGQPLWLGEHRVLIGEG